MRALLIAALLAPLTALAGDGCDTGCDNGCDSQCESGRRCCSLCDDASDYRCQLNAKEVEAERSCFKVECVPVVVAPVSCGNNEHCRSCGQSYGATGYCTGCGTTADCCDTGCDNGSGCGAGCGDEPGLKGLLSRLCMNKCRVRMVKKLSKSSKPDGTKCEYTWEAVSACGCHEDATCDRTQCVP